jgi:hypothetical protein
MAKGIRVFVRKIRSLPREERTLWTKGVAAFLMAAAVSVVLCFSESFAVILACGVASMAVSCFGLMAYSKESGALTSPSAPLSQMSERAKARLTLVVACLAAGVGGVAGMMAYAVWAAFAQGFGR